MVRAQDEQPSEGLGRDALYQQSMKHFQNGDWQQAITGFEEVLRLDPGHVEARAFLEEAELKAALDHDRPAPKRVRFPGQLRQLVVVLAAVAALALLVLGVRWAYERWVTPAELERQTEISRALQSERAWSLLARQDYAAAEEAFRELLAEDPANTDAQNGLAAVQKQSSLAAAYGQADEAMSQQDWEEATRLLDTIAAVDPNFRDVQTKRASVKQQQILLALFEQAEAAYRTGNWTAAIISLEALGNLSMDYQRQVVLQHLFDSYLQQGKQVVKSTKGDRQAVQQAKELYRRALTLQPQQAEAKLETALAERYLEGLDRLAQSDVNGAIAALDWVCSNQADYAGGNAALLLKSAGGPDYGVAIAPAPVSSPLASAGGFLGQYGSLVQKGDEALAAAQYAQAEEHYGEAKLVAVHLGLDAGRWLLAACAKLATTYAAQSKYAEATEAAGSAMQIAARGTVVAVSSSLSGYIEDGDRRAKGGDYLQALEQYDQALRIIGPECQCGLQEWSLLP